MQKHASKRSTNDSKPRSSTNANRKLNHDCQEVILRLTDGFTSNENEDFAVEYLKSEYLSKYNDEKITPAAVRQRNAIEKWFQMETKNAETNRRLRGMDRGFNVLPRVTFYSFLSFSQRLVSQILGPLRDSIVLGSFSGGASTGRRRTESQPARKFVGMADITQEAMPFIDVIHREAPLLRHLNAFTSLREVAGCKMFTVPKKTDIDRVACKEPEINMFLQKGVGDHIRRRLRKFGINLNDQSINRALARQGSLDNSLATLDLSSASDTVTISLVQALLPHDWFLYLDSIRSHSVEVEGRNYRTEMFSSMGNGFTFELESLLFYVLMRTTAYFEGIPGIISVYGDDIIIPSGMYDNAVWVLKLFGFTPNTQKSFHDGPFRESCGGHYHNGRDVTPFYLKRKPTHLTDVIRVCNQLRRWACADPLRIYTHPSTYIMWSKLAVYIPKALWGGSDLDVDTQLVSLDRPRSKLVRAKIPVELPELGSYLHWHCTNWNRASEPDVSGQEDEETTKFCHQRRAKPGASVCGLEFYEELRPNTDSG